MNNSDFLYEKGIIYIKAHMWDEAIECLKKVAESGNSSAMFGIGSVYEKQGEMEKAIAWYKKAAMNGHFNAQRKIDSNLQWPNVSLFETESFNQLRIIRFGNYDWLILEEKCDKLLILSKNIIDIRQYHAVQENITWNSCNLHFWLNNDFYNTFSSKEKGMIVDDTSEQSKEMLGNIFCLSCEEVMQYFEVDVASNNHILIANISMSEESLHDAEIRTGLPYSLINGQPLGWWLRNAGEEPNTAMRVNCRGNIRYRGRKIDKNLDGVRPAIWLRR